MKIRDYEDIGSLNWDTVEDVVEKLRHEQALIEEKGGTSINFKAEVDRYDSVQFYLYYDRDETEKERLEREKNRSKDEQRELAELKRLKAKYEKKGS